MPQRIQLRRTKGWRKPAGAVVVARPSKWGNSWRVGDPDVDGTPMSAARAVERYRMHLALGNRTRAEIAGLRGRDLACWCKPGAPCHADVLLELANAGAPAPSDTEREEGLNDEGAKAGVGNVL